MPGSRPPHVGSRPERDATTRRHTRVGSPARPTYPTVTHVARPEGVMKITAPTLRARGRPRCKGKATHNGSRSRRLPTGTPTTRASPPRRPIDEPEGQGCPRSPNDPKHPARGCMAQGPWRMAPIKTTANTRKARSKNSAPRCRSAISSVVDGIDQGAGTTRKIVIKTTRMTGLLQLPAGAIPSPPQQALQTRRYILGSESSVICDMDGWPAVGFPRELHLHNLLHPS